MAKIQRNAPCPCGSGKKYKKCCINRKSIKSISNDIDQEVFEECEALNALSNSVIDLIDEGKLDEAESVCAELSKRYPDQVDGIERLAMVYEARGDNEKAADFYNKTAQFAQSKEGFDPEYVNWALDKAKTLIS